MKFDDNYAIILMIIKRKFCLFPHKNICCGCSLELPQNHLSTELPLMSTHNIDFYEGIPISTHNIDFMKRDENYPLIII